MSLIGIVIHWTAGSYTHAHTSLYHALIDNVGTLFPGKLPPESNLPHNVQARKYIPHCGGGNTGRIGVAMMAMGMYKGPKKVGPYPITRIQFETAMRLCARLVLFYDIDIDNVITHYEFGKTHPNTPSAGKIDITYLPPFPELSPDEIGPFIRSKVMWYVNKIKKETPDVINKRPL